jgi:hypothetical protein
MICFLDGRIFRDSGKEVAYTKDKNGYLIVFVKGKNLKAHRVVYSFFNGEIPNGMTINHKNGIKSDNSLNNLEVMTIQENINHAMINKLRNNKKGQDHGRAILDDLIVLTILTLPKKSKNGRGYGFSNIELSMKYNVSATRVCSIRSGREWKHLQ